MKSGLLRRNLYFRYLWFAQSGSFLGDWFNQVAITQTALSIWADWELGRYMRLTGWGFCWGPIL
ncbi:hypothetical protein C1X05_03660 [Laceyella sacchari]|uniref:Uncharacterized protein n=1 Tax=Laceyella tengchongensis TaxID=574699 RepID=A0AA45WIZ0_9BACL|nr:hypothetical protein [Laceyella tengchongensis]AUS08008.1 hypothetical protein C1X05_03660 [Laceyella sacchari]MRG27979.1 hypothetical protein [Laceyella tengchongensis]SMP01534.1 hypothetical protein SAMN06265361_101262 [Laceyella tengchongensis]